VLLFSAFVVIIGLVIMDRIGGSNVYHSDLNWLFVVGVLLSRGLIINHEQILKYPTNTPD